MNLLEGTGIRQLNWLPLATTALTSLLALQPPCEARAAGASGSSRHSICKMETARVEAEVALNGLRQGTRVDLVSTLPGGHPEVRFQELRLAHLGRSIRLSDLNQLKGLISIENEKDALAYVRLRTALNTWYLWKGHEPREVEIQEFSKIPHVAPYGLPRRLGLGNSGYLGVLTSQAYMEGGFHPPIVSQTGDGFTITRWTFTRGSKVEKIQETVSGDGAYTRMALTSNAPPKLTGTAWRFPFWR